MFSSKSLLTETFHTHPPRPPLLFMTALSIFWLSKHFKYFTGFLISLRDSLGCNLGDGTLLDNDGGGCCNGSEERKQKVLRSAPYCCLNGVGSVLVLVTQYGGEDTKAEGTHILHYHSLLWLGSTAPQPAGEPGCSDGFARVLGKI